MFTITKSFDFEYAHRVYSQNVDSELACEKAENTCRHIHGHSGKLTVTLGSPLLDQRGFVVDYKEMGFIKAIVKECLDHKTILSVRDPLWGMLSNTWNLKIVNNVTTPHIKTARSEDLHLEYFDEFLDGISLVDIIPTSEGLAELFFHIIEAKLKAMGLPAKIHVEEVSWSETPSSTATYREAYRT